MTARGDDGVLELRGPVEPPAPRRRLRAVMVAASVLAALAALVVLPADRDVEVAVDETTTTSTPEAREVPDPASFPTPIALGGPTDGTESIGLPVKADPSTGLVDGQTVTVTGTGFPPGVSVGVVMCAREAGRDHGARGAAACNLGRFAQTESDADGVATVAFDVHRLVTLDGEEVDCASEPGRCLIGMGMISDYDVSGGVLVDFDPSVPLPDPPTVSVEPAGELVDGQRVTVRVEGLLPGGTLHVNQCLEGLEGYCLDGAVVEPAVADDAGSAELEVTVWRAFAAPPWDVARTSPNVDCVVEACSLTVWAQAPGDRAVPAVPLRFADRPLDRSPIDVRVTSRGPYRPGDVIEVLAGPLPAGTSAEPVLCGPEQCTGGAVVESDWSDGTLRLRMVVPRPAEGLPCDGPCRLGVHVWVPAEDGPPPLLPERVEIDVRR